MTTDQRNQDRTGQLSTHNIFYQTVDVVTQFIQKTGVPSQNNTRRFKVKLFPAIFFDLRLHATDKLLQRDDDSIFLSLNGPGARFTKYLKKILRLKR